MKSYVHFLLALLASLAVWTVMNLTRQSTDVETLSIVAHSNIEGRREVAYQDVDVTAVCTSTGFRLLGLASRKNRPVDVFFDSSQLEYKEGDFFVIPGDAIYRASAEIFGAGVSVTSLLSGSLLVRFLPENSKKVPVRPVSAISYAPQYMALGEMSISPDSVLVYGEPARLESVECVYSGTISHSDVKRSVRGSVKLSVPGGTRLSESRMFYSQEVTRYVEVQKVLPVASEGVPEGRVFLVYPSDVRATLRYVFPRSGAAAAVPSLFVSYEEFASSLTGRCVVHSGPLPQGVISFTIDPEVCECVER